MLKPEGFQCVLMPSQHVMVQLDRPQLKSQVHVAFSPRKSASACLFKPLLSVMRLISRAPRLLKTSERSGQAERGSEGPGCRKLGVLPQLVHILASGEESGLVAAALWALLQLAADDPANQRVSTRKGLPATGCMTPSEASSRSPHPPAPDPSASPGGNGRTGHAEMVVPAVRAFCMSTAAHALQAMATLGAVPHLVRLLESFNAVIAERASECLLHIVAPSDGRPALCWRHTLAPVCGEAAARLAFP